MVRIQLGDETIHLDATPSQGHRGEADVTTHPIEVGADVADHVRPRADELQLEAVVVDWPRGGGGFAGRARQVYERLDLARRTGELLHVTTTLREYPSVVIRSLSVPRDKDTAAALRFSLGLVEVVFAHSQTVEAPRTSSRKTQSKQNDGQKTASDATAGEASKGKSMAARAFDALFGR